MLVLWRVQLLGQMDTLPRRHQIGEWAILRSAKVNILSGQLLQQAGRKILAAPMRSRVNLPAAAAGREEDPSSTYAQPSEPACSSSSKASQQRENERKTCAWQYRPEARQHGLWLTFKHGALEQAFTDWQASQQTKVGLVCINSRNALSAFKAQCCICGHMGPTVAVLIAVKQSTIATLARHAYVC